MKRPSGRRPFNPKKPPAPRADESLSKKIDTVQSGYKSADGKLDAAIKSESTARSTADEALGKRVDKTVADFQAADKKIQGSVTSESKARADGDTALGQRIDTVTADYKKADKANTAAMIFSPLIKRYRGR